MQTKVEFTSEHRDQVIATGFDSYEHAKDAIIRFLESENEEWEEMQSGFFEANIYTKKSICIARKI